MSHESSATAGMRKTATCAADESAISRRERDLPPVRDDHGAAVLGRVADDRDDHGGDEELAEADLLGEHLERADEDLGDERGGDRRDGERAERRAKRPPLDLLVGGDVHRAVPTERVPRDDDVDDEQHDRDPAETTASEWRSGSPSQPGTEGMRKSNGRERDQPEREKAREAIERPAAAGDERDAEDEQEVPDDATRERAADDLGQALVHGDERDDQLGRVPERGVEEAADPRPGVLGGVLGRLADQPGERDQRERREHELRRLGEVGEVVERDRDRRERQRREEDLPSPRPRNRTQHRLPGGGTERAAVATA